jgi:molecular chaperone HscB
MDCWSCGAERGDAPFCTTCGKIQPLAKSYGLFESLSLPRRYALDRNALETAFREASKKVHPDRFAKDSPIERRLALEHTTLVNDAYRTLKDPARRAEHLLSLEGIKVGSEDARTKDPAFLMEMMELQEAVDDAKDRPTLERQEAEMQARQKKLLAQAERYFDHQEGTREQIARALDELRYLRRLGDSLEARLEES